MSDFNRSEFDDDDDFNLDDNDDFSFPEDEGDIGGDQQDFDFGDEEEFTFDEGGLDLEDEIPELEEVEGEREGGVNRTFIIIAALMILLFVGGLVAVVLLSIGQGPTDFELTSTSIALTNEAVIVAVNASETAAFDIGQTQTAEALFTPTPTPTELPTREPTVTPTPTLDQTQVAALSLTEQAQLATSDALTAAASTPTGIPVQDVQLTATALAALLGQGGGPTPTAEVPTTPGAPQPTALPETGFFDDLATSGSSSVSMLALMALGLVGVIAVSRRLRAANNRSN